MTKEQFSYHSRQNSCNQINRNSCTSCKIIYILLTFKEALGIGSELQSSFLRNYLRKYLKAAHALLSTFLMIQRHHKRCLNNEFNTAYCSCCCRIAYGAHEQNWSSVLLKKKLQQQVDQIFTSSKGQNELFQQTETVIMLEVYVQTLGLKWLLTNTVTKDGERPATIQQSLPRFLTNFNMK